MKKSNSLQATATEKPLTSLPRVIGTHLLDYIYKITHNEPIIGIMGKTDAGKLLLCNELLQSEVTPDGRAVTATTINLPARAPL
ncbi:hypothetical protein ACHEUO_07530 [Klebsiella oxytoca]|uniref:hypothetical protein n=1 Tax=Klebsiella oxytoca TaxID=571 RepID=UPI0037584E17|nr:hypothetical protein [Klebsiella pneumoniae]